jgi:putative heme-binding domain-containing protein
MAMAQCGFYWWWLWAAISLAFAPAALLAQGGSAEQAAPAAESPADFDDYNQWKRALGGDSADAASIAAPPGFRVERLRLAAEGEGSWISIDFDPRGRLVVAREDQGLLRFTLPEGNGKSATAQDDAGKIKVETINDTLLECRGLLHAHGDLYVNANNSKALYRLRDADGDDRFEQVELLRKTEGGVGHGRNDLALGPDGMIYVIHGNNVLLPEGYQPEHSPLRNWGEDQLLDCGWDQALFDSGVRAPAGHLVRTDRDGRRWELVAGGLRNPYGIDFNADGELFTYESDMEWDVGTPWYRPTRVLHLASGGEYGYRQGTRMWPAESPDALPAAVDIGKGSPTGVKFGTRSRFPEKYRRALFIAEWAYGRIFAVHLEPHGASYRGRAELFLQGRPLNVTDLDLGPDGAMYFVVGGRKTRSALYRVSYEGADQAEKVAESSAAHETEKAAEDKRWADAKRARDERHELEQFHGRRHERAVETAWPYLASSDVWLRHAARVAIEAQPFEEWCERAMTETHATAALTALMALARVGPSSLEPRLLERLGEFPLASLSQEQQLLALRVYELALVRMGRPDAAHAEETAGRLSPVYPTESFVVNRQLSELLAALDAPGLVAKTMPLILQAKTQEERLHYLFVLRSIRRGWTLDQRRTYFRWLSEPGSFSGAQSAPIMVKNIEADARQTLSEEEQSQLAEFFAALKRSSSAAAATTSQRPFVRDWKLEELVDLLGELDRGRNYQRGREMAAAAQCASCHRVAGAGTAIGPDLAGAGRRFGRRDLLETILAPSKFVDEKYRNEVLELADGTVIVGRVTGGDEATLFVLANPLEHRQTRDRVAHDLARFADANRLAQHARQRRDSGSARLPDCRRRCQSSQLSVVIRFSACHRFRAGNALRGVP